jgi:hypothetical protein
MQIVIYAESYNKVHFKVSVVRRVSCSLKSNFFKTSRTFCSNGKIIHQTNENFDCLYNLRLVSWDKYYKKVFRHHRTILENVSLWVTIQEETLKCQKIFNVKITSGANVYKSFYGRKFLLFIIG